MLGLGIFNRVSLPLSLDQWPLQQVIIIPQNFLSVYRVVVIPFCLARHDDAHAAAHVTGNV